MITRMPKKKKSLATNNCRPSKKTMKEGGCALDSLSLAFCLTLLMFSGDSESALHRDICFSS